MDAAARMIFFSRSIRADSGQLKTPHCSSECRQSRVDEVTVLAQVLMRGAV